MVLTEFITNQMKKKLIFCFKSVQICMKDAECSETNEESNFRFLQLLKYGKFSMNFHHNWKKNRTFFFSYFIRFSTIWNKKSKRLFLRGRGGGGGCRSLIRNNSRLYYNIIIVVINALKLVTVIL